MKIFKRKVIQFCGATCLVPMLLSSCASSDSDYAGWGDGPVYKAGPDSAVAMETTIGTAGDGSSGSPVISHREVVVEKEKKSGFFGGLGGRKSEAAYVPYDGPMTERNVAAEGSLLPEPSAPSGRRSPPPSVVMEKNKKKPAGNFENWLKSRN